MSRIKLRYGGKCRRKAFLGADGAVMAAATIAAAGITAGATAAAAKSQSKAVVEGAKTQAQSIKSQTENSNNLQKENINFTRQQNQENRQQQQDIQTTLQLLAGQENMNDRMEANKMQVKLGGKPKRRSISSSSYGGGQFQVTDGGGVLPISITPDGYGLYELYGNDHEHYHKTKGGKNKTGVGIKFNDGSVVEGEGNQNTNQGELLYVTPNDAMFLSKHSIDGFNPTKAVLNGIHPEQAFIVQELLKAQKGLNDDGSRKRRNLGGIDALNVLANTTQFPNNGTASVAGGMAYLNREDAPIAKCGKRISLKRRKAAWGDYAGATYNSIGNVVNAGINTLGNMFAANSLGKAYNQAGNILADAYSQMHGIDMSELYREDFEAPHTLAVVRRADTNINPQLEHIRRNASSEKRAVDRNTLSSAARQQRLAEINDRMAQRINEQYATKLAADEQIKQGNAERITQTAQANADRDVQARKDYGNQRLALLQYNNNIENAKIAGMAQSRADAITQSSLANAQGLQSSLNAIGSAVGASGNAFASAYDAIRKDNADFRNTYVGLGDAAQVTAAILRAEQTGDKSYVNSLLKKYSVGTTEAERNHYDTLAKWATSKGYSVPEFTGTYRKKIRTINPNDLNVLGNYYNSILNNIPTLK